MRLNCNEMMQDVRESATRSTKRGGEEEEAGMGGSNKEMGFGGR